MDPYPCLILSWLFDWVFHFVICLKSLIPTLFSPYHSNCVVNVFFQGKKKNSTPNNSLSFLLGEE